jgi:hypothetical protein
MFWGCRVLLLLRCCCSGIKRALLLLPILLRNHWQ